MIRGHNHPMEHKKMVAQASLPVALVFLGFLMCSFWPVFATSLWDEKVNGGRSIFADRRAFRRGDLITITISLSTVGVKDQKTTTSKVTSESEKLEALLGPFLGGSRTTAELDRRNPHNTWSGTRSFTGSGKIENTETFTATIQARVTDVMPNKALRIEATRHVEFGEEKSDFVLSGVVREEDITTANTVTANQMADLQVKQVTNGPASRETRKGWLTKLWEFITPF